MRDRLVPLERAGLRLEFRHAVQRHCDRAWTSCSVVMMSPTRKFEQIAGADLGLGQVRHQLDAPSRCSAPAERRLGRGPVDALADQRAARNLIAQAAASGQECTTCIAPQASPTIDFEAA